MTAPTGTTPLEGQAVMRSGAVMAAGTLVSRILGFIRAAILVWAIGGQSASADAFDVANTVPNNLYLLLAGGVLNAVLVPQVARAARQADGGQLYLDRLLTLALTVLAVVTVVITALAPVIVNIYWNGDPQALALSVAFAFWCLPQVFFYGVYTLLGQVLNARGSFGPFTWAPVLNNVVSIIGLLLFIQVAGSGVRDLDAWDDGLIALLAGTATLGIVAQALILWVPLRRSGFRYRPRWKLRGAGLGSAGRVAGWTFGGVLLGQAGFIVTSRVATEAGALARAVPDLLVTPSKASYTNAFLLFMLPHSLVAVSLVTALFTQMSHSVQAGRVDRVRADLSLGMRTVSTATVPAVAAFLALGPSLTQAFYVGTPEPDTRAIAWVAMAMMVGLVPFSASFLVQRVFYAYEDARTPFFVQIPVVLAMVAGNLAALEVLPPQWVVVGIAATASASHVIGFAIAMTLVRRKLGRVDGRRILRTHLRLLLAGLVAGLAGWGATYLVNLVLPQSPADGWEGAVITSVVGLCVVLGVYLAACRLMHVTELGTLLSPLRGLTRRVRRS